MPYRDEYRLDAHAARERALSPTAKDLKQLDNVLLAVYEVSGRGELYLYTTVSLGHYTVAQLKKLGYYIEESGAGWIIKW